jgi:peptidyl-prolyl cis-trans isomerase B (cyclophilin B)
VATNQQRREAAKRKLERQLAHRAARAKRRKIVGAGVVVGVALVVAGVVVTVVLSNRGSGTTNAAASPSATPPSPTQISIPIQRAPMPQRPQPLANPVTCTFAPDTTSPAAKPVNPPPNGSVPSTGTVAVTLKTTAGDIPLTLDRALAPCAVDSFISLAKQGFYTNTSCHRLGTSGLQMLQCGDPKGNGTGGPGYTIADENFPQLTYGRGILAMAKTSAPNSGGSQFFMVYGNAQLPPNYSVFGSISDAGLQVLDKVARAGVDPASAAQSSDGTGTPAMPVKFTAVTVQG